MADAAIALLRDPARREAMGRAAAADVHTRFREDVVVPLYEAFYREVIEHGRA
jgi:glycosyltransferase involved in cell wall biosynthesis